MRTNTVEEHQDQLIQLEGLDPNDVLVSVLLT